MAYLFFIPNKALKRVNIYAKRKKTDVLRKRFNEEFIYCYKCIFYSVKNVGINS